MKYFPIFLDLEQRGVLVAGGGEKAAQKVRLLAKTPARITVVGAEPGPEIAQQAAAGKIDLHRRPFRASDADGMALVIAADDHSAANAAVAAAAKARAMLPNERLAYSPISERVLESSSSQAGRDETVKYRDTWT